MVLRLNIKNIALILLLFTILIVSCFLHSRTVNTVSKSIHIDGVYLPVIMYHQITNDIKRTGKYTISTEQFEKDLLFLKEKGYTTVTTDMLISYVNGERDLPDRIIMLTFDDGFESFYCLAYPLLIKHKMHCMVSVIGILADEYTNLNDHNINYSYLTWQEIKELDASPYIEIQSHTYDLHHIENTNRKGMQKNKNETAADYKEAILADLLKMQKQLKEKAAINATAIAYPYGLYSKETIDILKKNGYKASFTCEEKINVISKENSECLYNLGRYNRPSGVTCEEFFEEIIMICQTKCNTF